MNKISKGIFFAVAISCVALSPVMADEPLNEVDTLSMTEDSLTNGLALFSFKAGKKVIIKDPLAMTAEKGAEFVPGDLEYQEYYQLRIEEHEEIPMLALLNTYKKFTEDNKEK